MQLKASFILSSFYNLAMSKQKNKNYRDQSQKNMHQNMRSLRTAQEEQIEDAAFTTPHKTSKSRGALNVTHDYDGEEQQMLNVSVGELKDTSTDKITAAINELIAKNKISAKNAFDVPMIHLKQTKEYNSLNGDNNWKKISSTLDSNNKIYGYRVDATHNHTYKVLQLLTRQEKQTKNRIEEEVQREELQTNFLQFQNQEHAGDEVLSKYLQKNYKGINIVHLQTFFNVNPILEKTKRIFDQQGLRGLLLNNIEISKNLLLKLSFQPSSEQQKYNQQYSDNNRMVQIEQEIFCDETLGGENIFTEIYDICYLNDLIEKQAGDGQFVKRQENEIDIMWKQFDSLAQNKPKTYRNHQNLIDLNSELTNPQEQNNHQNEEYSRQPEIKIENVQKQPQTMDNPSNLPLEILENNSPINQTNDENLKQPTLFESIAQVASQGMIVNLQNDPTDKNKSQSVFNDQKELAYTPQCQNKPFLSQISRIQSDNTPLASQFQLTKASNLTDPLSAVSRHIPISQVIRLSRNLNSSQLFLKEIEAGEEHDKDENQVDVVDKWKNGDKKVKTPRKPKKTVEKPIEQIDFLLGQSHNGKKLRQKVLKIQKVRKLELKKFMKDLKTQRIFEHHLNIDTSRYKFDFKFTTFYREDLPLPSQVIEYTHTEQPQQLLFQTNMLCNLSSYIDLVDQNNSSQTKTVSVKYVKHKLHSFIFKQKLDSFTDIYYNFINLEGYITPALCFLTVLHLTNQHGLRLQRENEDIRIFHGEVPNLE